jgi:hypothetical protein
MEDDCASNIMFLEEEKTNKTDGNFQCMCQFMSEYLQILVHLDLK